MRLLAVLAVMGALAPAAARADLPTDRPWTGTRVTESLRIAAEFWHATPNCTVRVFKATPAQLFEATGFAAIGSTLVPAPYPDCPVWISTALEAPTIENRVQFCSVFQHEVGHLLGYPHGAGLTSIMNPAGDSPVFGAYRRFVPRGYGAWWRANHSTSWATRP